MDPQYIKIKLNTATWLTKFIEMIRKTYLPRTFLSSKCVEAVALHLKPNKYQIQNFLKDETLKKIQS